MGDTVERNGAILSCAEAAFTASYSTEWGQIIGAYMAGAKSFAERSCSLAT